MGPVLMYLKCCGSHVASGGTLVEELLAAHNGAQLPLHCPLAGSAISA